MSSSQTSRGAKNCASAQMICSESETQGVRMILDCSFFSTDNFISVSCFAYFSWPIEIEKWVGPILFYRRCGWIQDKLNREIESYSEGSIVYENNNSPKVPANNATRQKAMVFILTTNWLPMVAAPQFILERAIIFHTTRVFRYLMITNSNPTKVSIQK